MDWKTFIANLVASLAWPLVVIGALFFLKDVITASFPRIKKLKFSNSELEFFQEEINQIANDAINLKSSIKDEANNTELARQYDFLIRLSQLSPRSAILESFRILETALYKAVTKHFPDVERGRSISPVEAVRMLQGKVLDKEQYRQIQRLRHIRNEAAHVDDFALSDMPVESYIDVALSIAARLDEMGEKHNKAN